MSLSLLQDGKEIKEIDDKTLRKIVTNISELNSLLKKIRKISICSKPYPN
jgi:DNA gyrase subunit B